MTERIILANFGLPERAEAAAAELRSHGFETVSVDRIGSVPPELGPERNTAINSQAATLSGLVLNDGNALPSEDAGPLLEASAAASGQSSPGLVGEEAHLVTVVCPEERMEEAVEILKRHGGEV